LSELSHVDDAGNVTMVDVGEKPDTDRTAVVRGEVHMKAETLALIKQGNLKKGDILTTAQIAGVMGAKRTAELIPLCHPLPLSFIDISLSLNETKNTVEVEATVKTTGKTGVEMEALTAVSVACLTIYDMAKAVDKSMKIGNIRLVEKRGGRSGDIVLE